ncbi:MAG: histidine kinase [Frankiales bacterium]|nr:histidine kinase [Frankiales bacterium]
MSELSADKGPFERFGVTVAFASSEAVLHVQGEVDLVSAPDLGAIVHAVIDREHLVVVLDLTELDFIDGAGLGVIAGAADRLVARGGGLIVRSASPFLVRVLATLGLSELLRGEQAAPMPGRLGPEQSVGRPGAPDGIGTPRATQPRRITAIPADNDVVDSALRLVVALARATVGGADGVSVSLQRHGHLTTVAASDQTISDMDAGQYATGEGPCVDASVEGRWFHVASLDDEVRWPAFIPRAQALGINAILSTPLLAREKPVGALNIYSRTAAAFAPKDQELASVFARQASSILTDAGLDVSDDELSTRLQEAMRMRQVIAHAQGVVMQRDGVSEEAAYTELRQSSQASDRPLLEEAERVLASALRPPRALAGEPDGGHHR